jgi:hypothetical protein
VGNEPAAAALWAALVPKVVAAAACSARVAAHPPLCMALLTACRGSAHRRAQLCVGENPLGFKRSLLKPPLNCKEPPETPGKGAAALNVLLCAAVRPPPAPAAGEAAEAAEGVSGAGGQWQGGGGEWLGMLLAALCFDEPGHHGGGLAPLLAALGDGDERKSSFGQARAFPPPVTHTRQSRV